MIYRCYLVDIHYHLDARILSVRVNVFGLCVSLTTAYSPTNEASESSQNIFYRALQKSQKELASFNKYENICMGDFNATIGMQSKFSGAWDNILGKNN